MSHQYVTYHINEIPNHFTQIAFCCERPNLSCSHSNGNLFTCEDNMLFSRVKRFVFRAKAHLLFHWCLYNQFVNTTVRCSAKQTKETAFLRYGRSNTLYVTTICCFCLRWLRSKQSTHHISDTSQWFLPSRTCDFKSFCATKPRLPRPMRLCEGMCFI